MPGRDGLGHTLGHLNTCYARRDGLGHTLGHLNTCYARKRWTGTHIRAPEHMICQEEMDWDTH